ncbi:MAG: SMEK domain-containing protein, partial [Allosphingosinicella sp.]
MITRGHFIGEIVDSLSDIARQVETRTKLNLNDLPVFVETFFKEVLNHLFALQLQNLNAERSNFPGLDLGDRVSGEAFQITAQRSSHKVNESLRKITDEALKDYPSVRILIVGTKQGSYTIDADQEKRVGFTEKRILDVNDMCKLTMDLSIDRLQSLFEQVRRETARVKVELEIPDEDA